MNVSLTNTYEIPPYMSKSYKIALYSLIYEMLNCDYEAHKKYSVKYFNSFIEKFINFL